MAVVFISPKQRQKVFFMGITIGVVVFLIIISLIVFLSGPEEVAQSLVFNKPKVTVNMSVFDSEQFKNLEPFSQIGKQFLYVAITKDKKQVNGYITADNVDQAKQILMGMDLTVSTIKEVGIGREDPFVPYYSVPATTNTTQKTTNNTNNNTKTNTTTTNKK